MKILSTEELQQRANACFELNPSYELVHVTEDGQCFGPTAESYAKMHARESGLQVVDFTKPVVQAEPQAKTEEPKAPAEPENGGILSDADKAAIAEAAGGNVAEAGSISAPAPKGVSVAGVAAQEPSTVEKVSSEAVEENKNEEALADPTTKKGK